MNNNTPLIHSTDVDALQARFGMRVASLLGEQAQQAPSDISERLRVAREQAVERGRMARRQTRLATASAPIVLGRGGAASLAERPGWWVKLASAMPLAMLVCGLLVIDHLHEQAQIKATADVDAALLSDDLPPTAYSDPGFAEYLKATAQQ